VTLKTGNSTDSNLPTDSLKAELKQQVAKAIGSIARPCEVRFTDTLPKTRSGKIMRRLLRDIAQGRETVGDTTTLEDFSVLAKLRAAQGEEE
jgi:acetyl-CoA synthetase